MEPTTVMTSDEIRAALKVEGITPAGISRDMKKSYTAVRQVINGSSVSHPIRLHIAKCLGRPVEEVFDVKANPTKKGRPITKGFFAA